MIRDEDELGSEDAIEAPDLLVPTGMFVGQNCETAPEEDATQKTEEEGAKEKAQATTMDLIFASRIKALEKHVREKDEKIKELENQVHARTEAIKIKETVKHPGMEETDGLAETGKPENSDDESEFIEVANKRLKLSHDEQRLMKNMHIDRPLLRAGGLSLLKQADDDEDFSTETEKMMKVVPGLKGAMLYARRRIIEKATAREMARSAASSTTLPPNQFVNEKGEDTVDEFIAKQKRTTCSRKRERRRTKQRRRRGDKYVASTSKKDEASESLLKGRKSRDRGTHAGRRKHHRLSSGSSQWSEAVAHE